MQEVPGSSPGASTKDSPTNSSLYRAASARPTRSVHRERCMRGGGFLRSRTDPAKGYPAPCTTGATVRALAVSSVVARYRIEGFRGVDDADGPGRLAGESKPRRYDARVEA